MSMLTVGENRTAAADPPRSSLAAYLRRCGGKDTLSFETVNQATAAARVIRARNEPGVAVAAQYFRVTLTLA